MTTEGTPTFVPGDVVFGTDPFKEGGEGRPWLLLSNHEGQPFHGEQYIALSLTTRTWLADLLEIDEDAWVYGGTPHQCRIVPWPSSRSITRTSTSGRVAWSRRS